MLQAINSTIQVPAVDHIASCDYPNIARVSIDHSYVASQQPLHLVWSFFGLELIRQFERLLLREEVQRLIHGPLHSSIGQEAVAVGMALALSSGDKIISTHRAHHHFLAKAIAHYAPPESDVFSFGDNESLRNCVRRTMAEIMGLAPGWVGGRGGSMHLFDDASGNLGTQAIVAGNVPYTSGIAFAEKLRQTGNVALAFLGDGAVSIGPFHEGVCIAKAYQLPAIFFIENNLYGVATSAREATALDDLALRAAGYNMPGLIVDGMNPLAVKKAIEIAKAHAVGGHGPVMIEGKTYRYFHQSGGMPGSAFGYRTKQEEKDWTARDPLMSVSRMLIDQGVLNGAQVEHVRRIAHDLVTDALHYCTLSDNNCKPQRRSELLPDPDRLTVHVRSSGREFHGVTYRQLSEYNQTRSAKLVTAKSLVIARWLETEPEAFVIGEDVANMKGGAYGATKEALKQFPQRVFNAPIAEGGIVGLGHGAAVCGMRPIVEIMFCDFALIAADELFNQVATSRYMYNGRVDVPLVLRSRCAAGRGYGAQHSGDTIGLFSLFPGWRIVAPTSPFEYIGLFNSAMRCLDPVLVMEHHELDSLEGPIPDGDLDFLLPLGKAEIRRPGHDLTVVTYLSMVPRLMRIAEQLADEERFEVEVIDLRSLDQASIDFDTIFSSVSRTRRAVIVEQAIATQGLGSFIATRLYDHFRNVLKGPIRRLSSHSIPIPVSVTLEQSALINDATIREELLRAVTVSG